MADAVTVATAAAVALFVSAVRSPSLRGADTMNGLKSRALLVMSAVILFPG